MGPNSVAHLSDDSPEEQVSRNNFLMVLDVGFWFVMIQPKRDVFQDSESVFHLDLPLSINRLEQRIGRTDNSGKQYASTISVLFNEPDSLWVSNYVTLLSEAVGIFNDSVATSIIL